MDELDDLFQILTTPLPTDYEYIIYINGIEITFSFKEASTLRLIHEKNIHTILVNNLIELENRKDKDIAKFLAVLKGMLCLGGVEKTRKAIIEYRSNKI